MKTEKRFAKVGDTIKIVKKMFSDDPYEVGDLLKVEEADVEGEYGADPGYVTETDRHCFQQGLYDGVFFGISFEEYEVVVEEAEQ